MQGKNRQDANFTNFTIDKFYSVMIKIEDLIRLNFALILRLRIAVAFTFK